MTDELAVSTFLSKIISQGFFYHRKTGDKISIAKELRKRYTPKGDLELNNGSDKWWSIDDISVTDPSKIEVHTFGDKGIGKTSIPANPIILEYDELRAKKIIKNEFFYDKNGVRQSHGGTRLVFENGHIITHFGWMYPIKEIFVSRKEYLEHKKNTPRTRPPLGLIPWYIRAEERLEEIKEAVQRYCEAGKEIPAEWTKEYCELYIKLKRKK